MRDMSLPVEMIVMHLGDWEKWDKVFGRRRRKHLIPDHTDLVLIQHLSEQLSILIEACSTWHVKHPLYSKAAYSSCHAFICHGCCGTSKLCHWMHLRFQLVWDWRHSHSKMDSESLTANITVVSIYQCQVSTFVLGNTSNESTEVAAICPEWTAQCTRGINMHLEWPLLIPLFQYLYYVSFVIVDMFLSFISRHPS